MSLKCTGERRGSSPPVASLESRGRTALPNREYPDCVSPTEWQLTRRGQYRNHDGEKTVSWRETQRTAAETRSSASGNGVVGAMSADHQRRGVSLWRPISGHVPKIRRSTVASQWAIVRDASDGSILLHQSYTLSVEGPDDIDDDVAILYISNSSLWAQECHPATQEASYCHVFMRLPFCFSFIYTSRKIYFLTPFVLCHGEQ